MTNATLTYRQALTDAMRLEMRDDPTVILLGEDVGRHGGARGATRGLFAEFGGDRVIDTPISEMAIAGAACGAALSGLRPVAENYIGDIIMFMADILVTSAAKLHFATGGKMSAPMVIRGADGSRPDGGPHQDTLAAWFAHIPGLKVVMPATPADAKGLLASAIRDDNPVVVFEPLQLYDTHGEVPEGKHYVPIGKAEVKAEGTDLTIVGAGIGVHLALRAREDWQTRGVSIEVVDLRTLRPLDVDTITRSVRKTGRLVVVHEGWAAYGIGAEIVACVAEAPGVTLRAPPVRVGTEETHLPASIVLSRIVLPNDARLSAAIAACMAKADLPKSATV
jgi:pyruvate dehydrogenase E1 component beta subunit